MAVSVPTAFILGAGASQPYGFPLGVELRDIVCGMADERGYRLLFRDIGYTDDELRAFVDALRFSARTSVDVFLEHNPDFLTIGKQAIAAALLPRERPDRLFPPHIKAAKHWYERLINTMEVGTPGWSKNALSVVTFNYDRSFEHYFGTVIARRASVSQGKAYGLLGQVQLVHVHGALGEYSPGPPEDLPYGAELTPEAVVGAANGIRVVGEVDDSLPTFDEAETLLRQARRIYFLGFGFHPDNVRRLRIFEDEDALDKMLIISGTSYGITDWEWGKIGKDVLHGCWSGARAKSHTVPDFIRHEVRLG